MRQNVTGGQIDVEKVKAGVSVLILLLPFSLSQPVLPAVFFAVLERADVPRARPLPQKFNIRPLRVADFFQSDYATPAGGSMEQEGLD